MANHGVEARIMALTEHSCQEVLDELENCGGVVIGTGTHWDNHSSRLQCFIEDATHTECTSLWLGKPLGIIVTAHSVGDSSVIQTLMRTFNNFGVMIPPCCTAGLTLTGQEALAHSENPHLGDVNCPEDLLTIAHNICVGMGCAQLYQAWPVSRAALDDTWINSVDFGEEE
jgi:multimeric flavodoxin WrbA